MLRIRPEQFNGLRKQTMGDALLKSFTDSGMDASVGPATDDIFVRDAGGNTTAVHRDGFGFVGGVTSPLGRRHRFRNDKDGKPLELTNPAGHRTRFDYDKQGHLRRVHSGAQLRATYDYNEAGRVHRISYAGGTTADLGYSASGDVSLIRDRLGRTETYTYDSDGDLEAVTDPNGHTTRFWYWGWSLPSQIEYPDGSCDRFAFGPDGSIGEIASGAEVVARIERDAEGRITRISYRDGRTVSYAYDDRGRVVEAANDEITITYEYDDDDRVVCEDQGGVVVRYDYDEMGSLAGVTYPTGERVSSTRDPDSRLASVSDWEGGVYGFSYHRGDRGYDVECPNGTLTTVRCSPVGLPMSVSVRRQASDVGMFSLRAEYDTEDRVKSLVDSDHGGRTFEYDAESQLLAVESDGGRLSEAFTYDAAGNRTLADGRRATYNALDQLTRQGNTEYGYDARGNMVSISGPDGEWRLSYNAQDLLARAEGPSDVVVDFGYDAFGRRAWKRSGEQTTRYVWAGEQLIREETQQGDVTETRDYLYVPGTFTPLALRIDGRLYTYHTDHMGTPRRLTDGRGRVVWSADYAAFGAADVVVRTIDQAIRFPGQYFDEETGLHYNRFRYYSPHLGRYISRDPLRHASGLNLYAYVLNDPVNAADPLGLGFWSSVAKGCAIVAAVAVGVAVTVALAPVAIAAVAALGASAAVAAAVGTGAAIIAGGVAGGAVGGGLNAHIKAPFCLGCIAKGMGKGALIGGIAAVPFALLPLVGTGYAAFAGAGALSGALSYGADYAMGDHPWSWWDFGIAVGGAALLSVGARYLFRGSFRRGKGKTSQGKQKPTRVKGKAGQGKQKPAPGRRRQNRLPPEGEPGTVSSNKPGTTVRKYGPDGRAQKEFNKGHQGNKTPAVERSDHIHDYEPNPYNPKGTPIRKPGRAPRPEDFRDLGLEPPAGT